MLALFRIIVVATLASLISLIYTIYTLFKFKNSNNVSVIARRFGSLHRFLGIRIILRDKTFDKPAIYVANHQNNYDMVTITNLAPKNTVTVGKKSLIWIPFFGLVYWASGNILIERTKKFSAFNTMKQVSDAIKNRKISVMMFPEGTRSRGRGMLPFKNGCFKSAIEAGVPIIPIVCSDLHNKIDLNRKNNGVVICEVLEPIDTSNYDKHNVKELVDKCYELMHSKFVELTAEAESLGKR